jgi:hypothetical protein
LSAIRTSRGSLGCCRLDSRLRTRCIEEQHNHPNRRQRAPSLRTRPEQLIYPGPFYLALDLRPSSLDRFGRLQYLALPMSGHLPHWLLLQLLLEVVSLHLISS